MRERLSRRSLRTRRTNTTRILRPPSRIRPYQRSRRSRIRPKWQLPSRRARPYPLTCGKATRSRRQAPPGPQSGAVRRRARQSISSTTMPSRSSPASRRPRSRSKSSRPRRRPSQPRHTGPPCPRARESPSSASTRNPPPTASQGMHRSEAQARKRRRRKSTLSRLTASSWLRRCSRITMKTLHTRSTN